MNKLTKEASVFFKKNQEKLKEEFQKKDVISDVFQTSLTQSESEQIECLVLGGMENADSNSETLAIIKALTSRIKAIQKHHVLLIGEKIYKVRELLNNSGSSATTFSSWIGLVFHTKSSAYNALAYYELFISLPNKDWKSIFQSVPYKTAYCLASRRGHIDDKMSVLEKIKGLPNTDAMCVLNKYLPSSRDSNVDIPSSNDSINKLISDMLLELLRIIHPGIQVSQHNMNLLQQLFENTVGNYNDKSTD